MSPGNPPRVVAFIGDSELGRHALELVKDHLVEIVTDDAAGRALGLVDWLNPETATAEALADLKPTHGISAPERSIRTRARSTWPPTANATGSGLRLSRIRVAKT
jgi:hypothetical protein